MQHEATSKLKTTTAFNEAIQKYYAQRASTRRLENTPLRPRMIYGPVKRHIEKLIGHLHGPEQVTNTLEGGNASVVIWWYMEEFEVSSESKMRYNSQANEEKSEFQVLYWKISTAHAVTCWNSTHEKNLVSVV